MPLRETTFINRNVENWRRLEAELDRPSPDPDVLRDLYAAASDDLSYARTHYPNRSVRSYLNQKAVDLSLSIYRNDRSGSGFWRFWSYTVPNEIYLQRIPLFISAAIFLLSFLIGWGSSVVDPEFPNLILGDAYVEMTKENIANGDPMGVYKDGSQLGGALGIAGNNLQVALLSFVLGILAGIGTLFILLSNGVMVGAFQQFFFAQGVGWESVMGIWTHGTIEISCIVIAAGSGLVLAKGILWPGTLSRSRAFQLTALSGLRVLAGTAPLIVLAAIIEGYLTRLTEVPTPFRITFLAINLMFVIGYFIIRPYQIGRHIKREQVDYGKLPPEEPLPWREFEIRSTSEGFFDTIRFMFGKGVFAVYANLGLMLLVAVAWVLLNPEGSAGAYYNDLNFIGGDTAAIIKSTSSLSLLVSFTTLVVGFSAITYKLHSFLPGGVGDTIPPIGVVISLTIPWIVLFIALYVNAMLALLLAPVAMLWMRGISYRNGNIITGLSDAFQFGFVRIVSVGLLVIMLLVGQLVLTWGLEAMVNKFILPFALLNFSAYLQATYSLDSMLRVWVDLTVLGMTALFWSMSFGLLYHRLRERKLVEGLRSRIERILPS